jgi:UDP-glucose 4-epimerase|tara:strand:- start:6078 stop:6998 length:921 start_codon:yes stop_codon:yes gene_type:complete
MRAIVTGGAGFIGSNLVDELLEKGWGVIILDDLSTGKKENVNANAKLYRVDISTMKDLENPRRNVWRLFEGVDIVFHLAAKARVQPSIVDPISFNKINVEGTLNILLASHNAKVKRVVYSASSSAYGNATKFPTPEEHPTNPLSPYGLQKYIGEQYCKMFSEVYGLDTVSLRYFNIYGERMNLEGAYCLVMGIFAKQMKEGKPLTINNDGKQKRDFTYVGDAINANILAATRKENFKGDVFNIGNGNNFSINEVADMMGGEKKYGNKVAEPFQTLADNSKAMLMLDWDPKGDLPSWIKKYKKEIGI